MKPIKINPDLEMVDYFPDGLLKKFDRKSGLCLYKKRGDIVFKLCSKCKKYKELNDRVFSLCNFTGIGFKSYCKECVCVTYNNPNYYRDKNYNESGLLKCYKCKQFKEVDNFYQTGTNPNRDNRSIECNGCMSVRKALARKNKTPLNDLVAHLKNLLRGCKSRVNPKTKKGTTIRAKKKDFSINLTHLVTVFNNQKGLCAISGIRMTHIVGSGNQRRNASIDRIDNDLGYIDGNIQLVCCQVNRMRGELPVDVFIKACDIISKYNEDKNKKI